MDKDVQKQAVELLSVAREGVLLLKGAVGSVDNDDVTTLREAVASADALCKAGLASRRYAYYHDIFDGCLMSIAQLAGFVAAGENIGEVCDLIADLLSTAEENLLKERTKKEIVFLPYKASMWDSLESIWLAARDDDSCTAVVVPIPYCDRNPDGSAREWHYEGTEFPKEVPITSYRKYNLAEHRPDVIYIHNPYDGCNYVTSVHPDYYSDKLKKYTDMLVYVPYDCTDGKHVSPHFPKLPGVVNADKVIVDNEKIKELYIKYYPDQTKSREYFDNKFLPLGSPKIDKVKRSKREDFELPEDWARKITGKRAILYNTHLSPLIATPEKQMAKIRYTFDVFKARTDMVLWWRPHPLSEATLQSMRPDAYEEYMKLKKEYLEADFGIYDDTADLYRSLTWTDAYYGDGSSVASLYQAMKKPVVLQDIAVVCSPVRYKLATRNISVWEGKAYFVDEKYSCLYSADMTGDKVQFLAKLYDNKFLNHVSYLAVDGKLIIAPWYVGNKDFLEYDLISKTVNRVSILKNLDSFNLIFGDNLQSEKYLIFLCATAFLFVAYDVQTKQYRLYNLEENLRKTLGNTATVGFGRGVIRGDVTVLPVRCTNFVVEVNLITENWVVHHIGNQNNKYYELYDDGNAYWLTQQVQASAIVKWDYTAGKVYELRYEDSFEINANSNAMDFSRMSRAGEEIIFLPAVSQDLLAVNIHSLKMRTIHLKLKKSDAMCSDGYSGCVEFSNRIFTFCKHNRSIVVISKDDFSVHEVEISMERKSFNKIREEVYANMRAENLYEDDTEDTIDILSGKHDYAFEHS